MALRFILALVFHTKITKAQRSQASSQCLVCMSSFTPPTSLGGASYGTSTLQMERVDFTEVKWPAKATQLVNGEAGIGTGNPGSRVCLACSWEAMLITPSHSSHLSPNCTGGMPRPDTYNSLFFTGIPFLWCHPSTLPTSILLPEWAFKSASWGTFLTVQWLRLCIATARASGSIPGLGTKDPTWYLVQPKKKSASQWPCPPVALRTYSERSGDFQNLIWSDSASLGSLWLHSGFCSQTPLTGALFLPHLVISHLCHSPANRSCPGSWPVHTSPMPMNLLCIPSLVSRWAPTRVFNWYIFAWHLHLHLEFWWESPAQCSPYCTLHCPQNPLYRFLFHLTLWKLHPCRCSGHIWTPTSLSPHIRSHGLYLEDISRDFSDGPVVKTLCSQYREAWVQSLVMELDPTCCN